MNDVGSHVLIGHVARLEDHHRKAHHAAHAAHDAHRTPPPAPEGPDEVSAPQRPNLGDVEGLA